MTQRNTCNQFTPQLWRATKCKFCFKDKDSHAAEGKENSTVAQNPPQSPSKRTYSTGTRPPEAFVKVTPRRAVSHIDIGPRSPTVLSSDSDSNKNVRPSRISIATPTSDTPVKRLSITSPIENINMRLEMNKQLIGKDDRIHDLEVRNLNLENEIRTLKEQNSVLSRTQQSEEEHRKLLDKIATLRRKLADMEVKYVKIKEEKEDLEEKIKGEEQSKTKLKIRLDTLEHEQYMVELKVEREQKHKLNLVQEKEELELELETLRKSYRSMQRESRRLSTTFDVDEERSRELEDQLRQTQRRLGAVEIENTKLREKMTAVETERQDAHITNLRQQLSLVKGECEESRTEIEELAASHLTEIQSLQSQISRLQTENDDMQEGFDRKSLELDQVRRELAGHQNTKTEIISKDEELESLRVEVGRLQDKCSALHDVELIHINLNRELDRQRERANLAEQQVRSLERDLESERKARATCQVDLDNMRKKEEAECRSTQFRQRAASLEQSLVGSTPLGILKKVPAERDNDFTPLAQGRFQKPAPPPNRRRPSRDHLQNRAKDSVI